MKQTPDITFRPFDGSDAAWQEWATLRNTVVPDYAQTAEEMKDWDKRDDPRCLKGRWFVDEEGVPVAIAAYIQNPWNYHPHRFEFILSVLPDKEGRGIGSVAYEHLLCAIAQFHPISVRTNVREDWTRGLQFAQDRGFVEDFRSWESRLNVETFDLAAFADRYHAPEKHGIVIKSAREWKTEDPDFYPKWYELDCEASQDVPSPEPLTFPPFEQWVKPAVSRNTTAATAKPPDLSTV